MNNKILHMMMAFMTIGLLVANLVSNVTATPLSNDYDKNGHDTVQQVDDKKTEQVDDKETESESSEQDNNSNTSITNKEDLAKSLQQPLAATNITWPARSGVEFSGSGSLSCSYDAGSQTLNINSGTISSPISLKALSVSKNINVKIIKVTGPITLVGKVDNMFRDTNAGEGSSTKLTRIDGARNINTSQVTSFSSLFFEDSKLESVDVSNWDTFRTTTIFGMFKGCRSLSTIDVSNWKTANVTDMTSVFEECTSVLQLNVSGWITSNVRNMNNVFAGCENVLALDVSKWNTRQVTSMNGIFMYCEKVSTLNVSGPDWKTSKVTYMNSIFQGCKNLSTIDVLNWDTSNASEMAGIFSGCEKIKSLDVSKLDTSKATTITSLFSYCSNLESIKGVENLATSNVISAQHVFAFCKNLENLDLSKWKTANVTEMSSMFNGMGKLERLNISGNFRIRSDAVVTNLFNNTLPKVLILGSNIQKLSNTGLPDIKTKITDPTTSRYTGKWTNVGNGTEEAPKGSNVWTSDELMTRYASRYAGTYVWDRSAMTVTFDADGGTPKLQTGRLRFGEIKELKTLAQEPTRTDYTFLGWSTTRGDRSAIIDSVTAPSNGYESKTVYAIWLSNLTLSKYPKKFDFGKDNILNQDSYGLRKSSNADQNDLDVKVESNQNDWKVSAKADPLSDKGDLLNGATISFESILSLANIVDGTIMPMPNNGPRYGALYNDGETTIPLDGTSSTFLISNSGNGKGAYTAKIDFDKVRLHVPNAGAKGKQYSTKITWTLDNTI